MPHPDDLRRWRGIGLGILLALAMWAAFITAFLCWRAT